MDKKYTCYCGLYCENCSVRAKINPAAKVLYDEMKAADFDEVVHMIPGGEGFWPFLKAIAENGTCDSCREGSGNPGCAIRICAKDKGVEMCALCERYPCEHLAELFKGHPLLKNDNALLRENGMEAWSKLQDERRINGFVYQDKKTY